MARAETIPILASNLQMWRLRRGMSVSALARAADVSKSTVSELERGIGNPSLDTLLSLVNTLHISLGSLFVDSHAEDESAVRRYEDAPMVRGEEGHVARLLAGWQGRGETEIAIVTLDANARRESKGNAPGVVERAVCVAGTVEVGTANSSAVLGVGDLLTFRSDQPHFYQAINGPGRLVVVQQYSSPVG